MPDATPTPTPTPPPAKKGSPKSDVNQTWLDELSRARQVARASLVNENAAILDDVEIDITLAPAIEALANKIEADLAKLKTARISKKTDSKQEGDARDALIAVISPIQTACRRKFPDTASPIRQAYYIGQNLTGENLDQVLIAANNILGRLTGNPPLDVLPGVRADGKIAQLTAAIATYSQKNTAQADDQSAAGSQSESIQADVNALAAKRRAIQLAADQAWPWRDDGVVQLRKDFLLPANQPFKD